MKFVISLGFLVAVTASPLAGLSNELPQIQQEPDHIEVDQRSALYILQSIKKELDAQSGNFKEEETNKNIDVLNAIRDILIKEVNEGDDSSNVKVQEIAKNNGLEHINKELLNNQNEAFADDKPEENNVEKSALWSPVKILRGDSISNNVDDSESKNIDFGITGDQYELKIAGLVPHIEELNNYSDPSSEGQSEINSEKNIL